MRSARLSKRRLLLVGFALTSLGAIGCANKKGSAASAAAAAASQSEGPIIAVPPTPMPPLNNGAISLKFAALSTSEIPVDSVALAHVLGESGEVPLVRCFPMPRPKPDSEWIVFSVSDGKVNDIRIADGPDISTDATTCVMSVLRALHLRQTSPVAVSLVLHLDADDKLVVVGRPSASQVAAAHAPPAPPVPSFEVVPADPSRSPASITTGPSKMKAGPDQDMLERVVRQNSAQLRFCYDRLLKKDPTIGGDYSVRFVIDKTGAVEAVTKDASTFDDPDFETCVLNLYKAMTFPAPSDHVVIVTYPFHFTPNRAASSEHWIGGDDLGDLTRASFSQALPGWKVEFFDGVGASGAAPFVLFARLPHDAAPGPQADDVIVARRIRSDALPMANERSSNGYKFIVNADSQADIDWFYDTVVDDVRVPHHSHTGDARAP